MELTKLPWPLPGEVFRSAMPFSSYDPGGELVQEFKRKRISLVVMLTTDREAQRFSGHDLRSIYASEGIKVCHLPIPDFSVPEADELEQVIVEALDQINQGESVAVHCHAGIGRTGMFLACLAKRGLEISAEEAVSWVREFIPGAVEVEEQEQLVRSM